MNWPHLLAQAEAEIVGDDPLLHPERIPLIDPRRRELSAPRRADAAIWAFLAIAALLLIAQCVRGFGHWEGWW